MDPVLVGVALALAVAIAVALVGVVWVRRMWAPFDVERARRARAAFEERFPPISDAEFLALCRPGTDPEVALKVRRMVAEYFDVEYERVHPSMTFVEDLGV